MSRGLLRASVRASLAVAALLICAHTSRAARCAGPHYTTPAARSPRAGEVVLPGIDVLAREGFAPLRGKRVGLITNQTGINRDGRATIDVLAGAAGVRLAALFSPEHGLLGRAYAGAAVANGRDARTGLPVYSLYGAARKPSAAMLRGLDVLVYDIQDIGSRSYTYISTLGLCMEAAAETGIPIVVLDRPDPIGADRVEGNIPSAAYRSFIGRYPVPYCYGLTVGELARMIAGERWIASASHCKLTVVPMEGYRRDMTWAGTGLPWRPTSPHVPTPDAAYGYPATGICGELEPLSVGIGTSHPFCLFGLVDIDGEALAAEMQGLQLPGVQFAAAAWSADVPARARYRGVRLTFVSGTPAPLTRIGFDLLGAVLKQEAGRRALVSARGWRMFDLACGTGAVSRGLLAGKSAEDVWETWNRPSAGFRKARAKYLLYPEAQNR